MNQTIRCLAATAAMFVFLPVAGAQEGAAKKPAEKRAQSDDSEKQFSLGFRLDGKSIAIRVDGDQIVVTSDGVTLAKDRVQRRGKGSRLGFVLKDEQGASAAYVRAFGSGVQLTRYRRSKRATIGIVPKPLSQALADHLDLDPKMVICVGRVLADRAAQKAGVKQHDVIIAIDGKSPVSRASLQSALKGKKPGDPMKVRVLRRGKELEIEITCERMRMQTGLLSRFGAAGDVSTWRASPLEFAFRSNDFPTDRGLLDLSQFHFDVETPNPVSMRFLTDPSSGKQILEMLNTADGRTGTVIRKTGAGGIVRSGVGTTVVPLVKTKGGRTPAHRTFIQREVIGTKPTSDHLKKFETVEKRLDKLEKMIQRLLDRQTR